VLGSEEDEGLRKDRRVRRKPEASARGWTGPFLNVGGNPKREIEKEEGDKDSKSSSKEDLAETPRGRRGATLREAKEGLRAFRKWPKAMAIGMIAGLFGSALVFESAAAWAAGGYTFEMFTMKLVPTFDATMGLPATLPTGVNDRGIVVMDCAGCGDSVTAHPAFGLSFFYRDKKYTELAPPQLNRGVDQIHAVAINNEDQVLVTVNHTTTKHVYNWLYDIDHQTWQPVSHFATLESNPKARMQFGAPMGLNDKGEILVHTGSGWFYGKPALGAPGSTVELQDLGEFRQVPKIPCDGNAMVTSFNSRDEFGGTCFVRKLTGPKGLQRTGFIYSGASYKDFAVPGAVATNVIAINSDGKAVGNYAPSPGAEARAFLYDGSTVTALDLSGTKSGGMRSQEATGINHRGQIVGDLQTSVQLGFLATPN
jgi:hypothetical protein